MKASRNPASLPRLPAGHRLFGSRGCSPCADRRSICPQPRASPPRQGGGPARARELSPPLRCRQLCTHRRGLSRRRSAKRPPAGKGARRRHRRSGRRGRSRPAPAAPGVPGRLRDLRGAAGGTGRPSGAAPDRPPRDRRPPTGPALPGRSEAERGGPTASLGPSAAAPSEPLPGSGARGGAEPAARGGRGEYRGRERRGAAPRLGGPVGLGHRLGSGQRSQRRCQPWCHAGPLRGPAPSVAPVPSAGAQLRLSPHRLCGSRAGVPSGSPLSWGGAARTMAEPDWGLPLPSPPALSLHTCQLPAAPRAPKIPP